MIVGNSIRLEKKTACKDNRDDSKEMNPARDEKEGLSLGVGETSVSPFPTAQMLPSGWECYPSSMEDGRLCIYVEASQPCVVTVSTVIIIFILLFGKKWLRGVVSKITKLVRGRAETWVFFVCFLFWPSCKACGILVP